MGWGRLLEQRRVERIKTTREEIHSLLRLAERATADANIEAVSAEGRFDSAYDAARALATAAIRAEGYRVRATSGSHYFTFLALAEVSRAHFDREAAYFNLCRGKRNALSYTEAAVVSMTEVVEIIREVAAFSRKVQEWLAARHPHLTR